MKLSVKKLALSCSILWGLVLLLVSTSNLIWPNYGVSFLSVIASIYPGYEAMQGISSIIIGTLYGIVDAGVGGAIFACLYNFLPD